MALAVAWISEALTSPAARSCAVRWSLALPNSVSQRGQDWASVRSASFVDSQVFASVRLTLLLAKRLPASALRPSFRFSWACALSRAVITPCQPGSSADTFASSSRARSIEGCACCLAASAWPSAWAAACWSSAQVLSLIALASRVAIPIASVCLMSANSVPSRSNSTHSGLADCTRSGVDSWLWRGAAAN